MLFIGDSCYQVFFSRKDWESCFSQRVLTLTDFLRLPSDGYLSGDPGKAEVNYFPDNLERKARKPVCQVLSKTLAVLSPFVGGMFNQQTTQCHYNIPNSTLSLCCNPLWSQCSLWPSVFPSTKWGDSTRQMPRSPPGQSFSWMFRC